ncbi:unnamed protein product, partial [Urochloa humidicola]
MNILRRNYEEQSKLANGKFSSSKQTGPHDNSVFKIVIDLIIWFNRWMKRKMKMEADKSAMASPLFFRTVSNGYLL